MDGGSFLEIGDRAGKAGGGAAVRNAVLGIVLVSFAEVTDDFSISLASNSKSWFLAQLTCRLSRFAAAVSSWDSALGSAPCILLVQGPRLKEHVRLGMCRSRRGEERELAETQQSRLSCTMWCKRHSGTPKARS